MNLSEESPFDQWNLKDEKGNLPVGDYQMIYRLGTASMNVTISVLSLDGLDSLKEGGYQVPDRGSGVTVCTERDGKLPSDVPGDR